MAAIDYEAISQENCCYYLTVLAIIIVTSIYERGMYVVVLIVYPVLALVLPIVFYAVKCRFIWLSIVLAVAVDLMMYWPSYSYYESHGLFIYLTLAQIVAMVIFILILKFIDAKTKRRLD